jgi:tetratricopeptide (TPR) repeat protein
MPSSAFDDLVKKAALALRSGHASVARELVARVGPVADLASSALLVRGLADIALEDWAAAEEVFTLASAREPDNGSFFFNRGLAEENLKKNEAAEASFERALALGFERGAALGNLSNIYRKRGRYEDAVTAAREALEAGAPRVDALNNLGLALGRLMRFAEAETAFEEAVALAPKNPFFWANRANLAADRRDFESSFRFFAVARALHDDPSIRRDEAMARLVTGDAAGWELYESRLEIPKAFHAPVHCKRWAGEDLQGKTLLLLSEQGMGDVLHFCRYGASFAALGASLIWMVPQPLVRLLEGQLPGRVISRAEDFPPAAFYLPLLSAPFALKAFQARKSGAYLTALPHRPSLSVEGAELKIGLVWTGSATHERDKERSVPLSSFAPLWKAFPDAQFFAPFVGRGLDEIAALRAPVADLSDSIRDFADTASFLAQMDLLISVDTAAAHLAGAMGVPCFLLLPYVPDWRWGLEGKTTDWYASLRLFRRGAGDDWAAVVERIVAEIRSLR